MIKQGDILRWEGENGVLIHGGRYKVHEVREGYRAQEFTLAYPTGAEIKPKIWYEFGEPFRKEIRRSK